MTGASKPHQKFHSSSFKKVDISSKCQITVWQVNRRITMRLNRCVKRFLTSTIIHPKKDEQRKREKRRMSLWLTSISQEDRYLALVLHATTKMCVHRVSQNINYPYPILPSPQHFSKMNQLPAFFAINSFFPPNVSLLSFIFWRSCVKHNQLGQSSRIMASHRVKMTGSF